MLLTISCAGPQAKEVLWLAPRQRSYRSRERFSSDAISLNRSALRCLRAWNRLQFLFCPANSALQTKRRLATRRTSTRLKQKVLVLMLITLSPSSLCHISGSRSVVVHVPFLIPYRKKTLVQLILLRRSRDRSKIYCHTSRENHHMDALRPRRAN